jgi:hypothetical protein
VDIEPDVEHSCLLKSLYLGNAATGLQATRLTGASFIISTPTRAGRLADASVDPTEARNDILGCFGRSDRSRLIPRDGILPTSAGLRSVTWLVP